MANLLVSTKKCLTCDKPAQYVRCAKYCIDCKKEARKKQKREEYQRHKQSYKKNSLARYERIKGTEDHRSKTRQYASTSYYRHRERLLEERRSSGYHKEYVKKNKTSLVIKRKQYIENNRDKVLTGKKAEYQKHKKRYIEQSAQWIKNNPEKRSVSSRKYSHNNRVKIATKLLVREELKAKGDFSFQDWKSIMERFDYSCAYCLKRGVRLDQDHVIPISKGGLHVKENIVPACRSCNSSKNNKLLVYWLYHNNERIKCHQLPISLPTQKEAA